MVQTRLPSQLQLLLKKLLDMMISFLMLELQKAQLTTNLIDTLENEHVP